MQLIANALIAGSVAALVAGGLSLVYGTLGVFNLALGQMVLLTGYAAWFLHIQLGVSLTLSVIFGLLSGAAVSWITFEIFVEPFYRHHRFLPLVTTIALSMILDGMILVMFKSSPKRILSGPKNMMDIFGARISSEQILLVVMTIIILCAFAHVLHSSAFGRKIRAVVQHPHAAMGIGISVGRLTRTVFVLSGIFAGFGGIFIGIDQNLSPVLAFPITIKAYAAIISGGKGHFWGAIAMAYLIALLEQLAVGIPWAAGNYIPSGYQQTVALLLIIAFLMFRPSGIFAKPIRQA